MSLAESGRGGASLTSRVAWASALAAALGGAVAALASSLAAHGLLESHRDRSLLEAARDLALEIREEIDEAADDEDREVYPQGRNWPAMLLHELDDVKLPGARAVIRDGGEVVAGDANLTAPGRGQCRRISFGGEPGRVCSVPMDAYVLSLATSELREQEQQGLFGRAMGVGALVGALLGWALSRFIAGWALSPLLDLRDRVRAVRVDSLREPASASALVLQKPSRGEVEELRQAVVHLVDRLTSALNQAQAFAAEAAHELRTPLTTISGEIELLLETTLPDRASLLRVQRQVAELSALVQRLLVLARSEDAQPETAELVDLSDVAQPVLEALAAPLRGRVRLDIADDVIVRGDLTLLKSMVANALDNALKFSEQEVLLHIRDHGHQVCIDVIDQGPGIVEAERERVFLPFVRSRSARQQGRPGHGMGLALIQAVAKVHRGSAEFLATEQGTQLRLLIPSWRTRD